MATNEEAQEVDTKKLVTDLLENHRVEELAQLTDRNPTSVFRWLSGHGMHPDALRKLLALAGKDKKKGG